MRLFRHEARQNTEESKRYYARAELLYTIVDFGAALSFIVGSIMSFFESTSGTAHWLYLGGSLLFAAKPAIRTIREIHLYRIGDMDDIAKRHP